MNKLAFVTALSFLPECISCEEGENCSCLCLLDTLMTCLLVDAREPEEFDAILRSVRADLGDKEYLADVLESNPQVVSCHYE